MRCWARIKGFHTDSELVHGAILGPMWLKCLSVNISMRMGSVKDGQAARGSVRYRTANFPTVMTELPERNRYIPALAESSMAVTREPAQ